MTPAHTWTQPLSPMNRKDQQHATEHLLRMDIYSTWCCWRKRHQEDLCLLSCSGVLRAGRNSHSVSTGCTLALEYLGTEKIFQRFAAGEHIDLQSCMGKKRHDCLIFKHAAYSKQLFVQKRAPTCFLAWLYHCEMEAEFSSTLTGLL